MASLAELPPHVTVDQVEQAARKRLGALSTQAVYDIMRALHAVGLVRRIEPAGSAALFETRVGDNHHHLVCRDCGRTVDVDCEVGEAPCLTPEPGRRIRGRRGRGHLLGPLQRLRGQEKAAVA